MTPRPYLRPAVVWVRAGLLPYEVGERYPDGVGNEDQGIKEWAAVPLLDAVVSGPVHADAFGDVLLSETSGITGGPYLVPDGPAAGDDVVGGRDGAWHLSTLTGS